MLMFIRTYFSVKHLLSLVWLVLLCSGPALAGDHLNTNPETTPYQTEVIKKGGVSTKDIKNSSFCMADTDGDGIREMVEGAFSRAIGSDGEDGHIKNRWQINLQPGWAFQSGFPLGAVADLNRDGIDEIYTCITNKESGQWRFVVLDAGQGKLVFSSPLPTGPDHRADGIWDGKYHPYFLLDNADGRGRPGVLLVREVGYDARPRGLVAVDPFTGQIIWEWLCGPNPNPKSVCKVDMGPQGQGIAFFGNAPDNLGGEEINGTSDDHGYVFLISASGELVWQHEVGPGFCSGGVKVADIGGDGQEDIVVYTLSGASNIPDHLAIWDWRNNRILAQTRSKAWFDGVAILDGPRPGTNWLVAGSNEGIISRYIYADSTLVKDKSVLSNEKRVTVTGVLDLLDRPGPEIIVNNVMSSQMFILDQDLNTQAFFQSKQAGIKDYPNLWQLEPHRKAMVTGSTSGYWVLGFSRRPIAWGPLMIRLSLVLGGLGLLFGVYFLGRKTGRDKAVLTIPNEIRMADREALYRLWLDLDDVKHEHMFEPSKGFRRLVWLLGAHTTELGTSPELEARIRKLLSDFQETDLPLLRGILARADNEGLAPEIVGRTTLVLGSAVGKLETLEGDSWTAAKVRRVQQELSSDLELIEKGFLDLWRTLSEFFTANPVRLLQGLLLAREIEFQRAGIIVKAPEVVDGQPFLCRVDTPALRYVLDNLLDNAMRAVRNSKRKELTISLERQDLEVVLAVHDTGKGIDEEDQERIFSGRFSSRGGGQGLFRSREILRRWRGEIELATSSSDEGSTFILRLPVAVKNLQFMSREAEAEA